jgi:two-component system sensor histidine kinase AlgZ
VSGYAAGMAALPPPRDRLYLACQLVGFGLYVATTAFQLTKLGMPMPRLLLEPAIAAAIGITSTHVLRRHVRANRWLTLGIGALAPRVLLASVALALVTVGGLSIIELGIYRDPQSSPVAMMVFATMRWTLVYLVWTSLYFGIGLVRHRQEVELSVLRLEKAQKAAELRALKAQLNPHFLFNSLNSIRALVSEEPSRAQDAITELSRMLRYTLRSGEEDVVTLERELATVEDYLALESLRLGDRLEIQREIEPDARRATLPAMLLLTLIENAIKHGIACLPSGGTLLMRASMDAGSLQIDVEHPRPAKPTAPLDNSNGIGLPNAAERLRLLFGEHASVTLDLSQAGRARAHAKVPSRSTDRV